MGIEDELKKYIDQRIDQRLAGLTVQLKTGSLIASNDAENDPNDEGEGGGRAGVVRKRKKKRVGKKKVAAGKKRGKKVSANSVASREAIYATLMARGPLRVAQIVDISGIAQSTVNKHLNDLMKRKRAARLQEGTKVLYKAVHDGRVGRKTAEKPGARKSEPPPSGTTNTVAA